MDFRKVSYELTKEFPLAVRKEHGIYFTPKPIRGHLFSVLPNDGAPGSILEPSFGSGEFVLDCVDRFPDAHIDCVELNTTLFDALDAPVTKYNADFLAWETGRLYDLILGNPPYLGNSDKTNIFVSFIIKCITKHLKDGGILAFVIPTSFNNSMVYAEARALIRSTCSIVHMGEMRGGFIGTQQTVEVFVCRKTPGSSSYIFRDVFSPDWETLEKLSANKTTLHALGARVQTGPIVWNQHKDRLRDTPGVYLVYASNIGDDHTLCPQTTKPQYIRSIPGKSPFTGPFIVVARGYGNAYVFKWALVPTGQVVYCENHVNVIFPGPHMDTVIQSLQHAPEFIRCYSGNGALSKTELEKVLPI